MHPLGDGFGVRLAHIARRAEELLERGLVVFMEVKGDEFFGELIPGDVDQSPHLLRGPANDPFRAQW